MRGYSTLWMVIVDCIVLHYRHIWHLRIRDSSLQFRASKINMALAWMDKLVKKLMLNPVSILICSKILSRHTYQFVGIWQFYKYGWLMRISEIFLLENWSINVPYHRLTTTIVCLNFYSSNLSRFLYFERKGNTRIIF